MQSRPIAILIPFLPMMALACCAPATKPRFTFQAIEFAPREDRQAAVDHYIAEHASPGTWLSSALIALRSAGASCPKFHPGRDTVLCHYASPRGNSDGDMPLGEISWTIRIDVALDGKVARASALRERIGL